MYVYITPQKKNLLAPVSRITSYTQPERPATKRAVAEAGARMSASTKSKVQAKQDLCICIGRSGFWNVAVPLIPTQ